MLLNFWKSEGAGMVGRLFMWLLLGADICRISILASISSVGMGSVMSPLMQETFFLPLSLWWQVQYGGQIALLQHTHISSRQDDVRCQYTSILQVEQKKKENYLASYLMPIIYKTSITAQRSEDEGQEAYVWVRAYSYITPHFRKTRN